MEQWWSVLKTVLAFQLAIILVLGTVGCRHQGVTSTGDTSQPVPDSQPEIVISEVSPPETLQELGQLLEVYQPEVTILSPQPDDLLEDDTVLVRLQVENLPLFKNEKLGLGPHLHVILDNQPHIPIYDLSDPLVFSNLSPGTHTLRVFAARPWGESFKNEGAFAQTTFHLYTKTDDNTPDANTPLLTYSHPQGTAGAEPILLDFYLTHAPLHLIAQESEEDDIVDWRIRCTIDGKSFVIDRWQPLYLTGFKPGKNWVQLEFLDELGNSVKNVFNNTVRVITYEPGGEDTLSQLIRGELSLEEARGIVDPNYIYSSETEEPNPEPVPEVLEEPLPEASPELLEEAVTLPDTAEELTPSLEEGSEAIKVPEEQVEPYTKSESSELESTPNLSEVEELLEEDKPTSALTSPETQVSGDQESTLDISPIKTETMPVSEDRVSQEEPEVMIPEIPYLEAIPSDSETEDPSELIELETELNLTVEEIVDSLDSTHETFDLIETGDIESPMEETVTEPEPPAETTDSSG